MGRHGPPLAKINTFFGRYFPPLTPQELEKEKLAYDKSIRYVDDELSRLLQSLEQNGLAKNTLVIVTSDHRESFGEHRLLHHGGALFREQIEVPIVLSFPGRIPAGLREADPVSLADIPATVLGVLDLKGAAPIAGASLSRYWNTSPQLQPVFAISELARQPGVLVAKNPNSTGRLWSIVTREWHLIIHEKNGPLLFRRSRDPESPNLASTPEGREVIRQLVPILERETGASVAVYAAMK